MPFEIRAMVEPAAVAVHAVDRAGVQPGHRVIVLGAGPIGNLVAQVAKARSAAQMYQRADYEQAIQLITGDMLRLDQLITTRYPFIQYPQSYQYIDANRDKAMKVMIEVG